MLNENNWTWKGWFRYARTTKLFYMATGFTILSIAGVTTILVRDQKNQLKKHQGIFRDTIRQNIRRQVNGLKPYTDDDLLKYEIFNEETLAEFQQWRVERAKELERLESKLMIGMDEDSRKNIKLAKDVFAKDETL